MKRTFWAAAGFAMGLGSSVYLQRRLRRAKERFSATKIGRDVAFSGKRVASQGKALIEDLRTAAIEGHQARVQHEEDLRDEISEMKAIRARATAQMR